MIKLPYEELKDLAKTQLCADHRSEVVVAWHSGEKIWTLRCGQGSHAGFEDHSGAGANNEPRNVPGHYPDTLVRNMSYSELNRIGQLPDGPIKDNIARRERKKAMTQGKQPTALTMGGVPATDLATGELLPPESIQALVAYAQKYELDPYRGHVVVMYSKPYITLDGYLYHAHQTNVPYQLKSRPLEENERKTYQIGEGDHAWLAEVVKLPSGSLFTGLGIVTQEEMTAKSKRDTTQLRSPVVAAHPWQLAQKRAEWQALRRAFPIGETPQEEEE